MKTSFLLPPALILLVFAIMAGFAPWNNSGTVTSSESEISEQANAGGLTLITDTPEEGFQLAITLSRKGVTETQPDRDVLFSLRDVYAKDPDALIASSQVIAIHFQTVAAANNYWRD